MAELIATNCLNVFVQDSNPKDFNMCIYTGIYACGGITALNGPTNAPYGTLIVLDAQKIDGYDIQIFINKGSGIGVYYRIGFGNWKEL